MIRHAFFAIQFEFNLFLAVVLSLAISGNVSRAQPLPKGTLSGTVVDSGGKPVTNARVWANTHEDKLLVEARTNADGTFRLGPVEPVYRHRFDLYFEADGFARHYIAHGTYSIFPGTNCDLGMIRMDRGRTYVAQVVDVDGKPRAGLSVKCDVFRHELGHSVNRWISQEVKTDANGFFRSQPMPVGYLNFSCGAPERQLAYHVLLSKLLGGDETVAPIRLQKEMPIHGTVKDENGKPVGGVKINAGGVASPISDAAGKFTLRGFGPEARFQMRAWKEGHESINWAVKRDKEGIHWLNGDAEKREYRGPVNELPLVMKSVPKAWIEGQAVDAVTGKPVRVEKLVLCQLVRKPDGEVERRG
ncbi:MAG: hypothetical protein EXR98_11220 [Gemmataceae bacterium]|nr:hypothetical protein [Gemmataceae bacterium]